MSKKQKGKPAPKQNTKNSGNKGGGGGSSKKEEGLVVEGVVTESLKGKFRVEIQLQKDGPTHEVLAHLAGKMRQFGIKIVPGDEVNIELSPYDITRGRIVYRLKKK